VSEIEFMSFNERLDKGDVKPPEAIVSGLLFRNSIAVMGAPEDSFKTHFALQLAISLAAGIPCFSFSCRKSSVVYLILEGGQDYIFERLEQKMDAMKVSREEVGERLYPIDFAAVRLDEDGNVQKLEGILEAIEPTPDVVILDPITYALDEDDRYSLKKAKLCRNLLRIANTINGLVFPIIHCRKSAEDNNNMDDFLGSGIWARAAATRIKLYRTDETQVKTHFKTRYAERPEDLSLAWHYPLLHVLPEQLKPRKECKVKILAFLEGSQGKQLLLAQLVQQVIEETGHNEKTVRAAIGNLEFEGKLSIEKLPKSAAKIVKLVAQDTVHAS